MADKPPAPLTPKPCFMCGLEITDPADVAAVPKAFSHGTCATADPGRYSILSMMAPCCEARVTLELLRGCLIQRRPAIPENEVWLWDPGAKTDGGCILRYAFGVDGTLTDIPVPPKTDGPLQDVEPPPPSVSP